MSMYIPAPRFYAQDPIEEYSEQLLTEWGVTHGHTINDGKCECGVGLASDDEIRKHWAKARLEQRAAEHFETHP